MVNIGLSLLAGNNGISLEWLILIIVVFGSIIFFAKSFQLGMVMFFLFNGLAFVSFFIWELDYLPALILMIVGLIGMAMSFWATGKATTAGGLV